MADKNNNEFKWNFNLDDTDSDFTDIDFTNGEYEKSDKDIQPVIFVRDETAKKKASAEKKAAEDEQASQSASAAKRPAAAKKPAAKKTAAKKKSSGGIDLNWKLIALIAAGVVVVALIVLGLTKCGGGKKETKAWTAVAADDEIKTLMDKYFTAKKDAEADDMRKVLVTDAVVNASILAVESQIYSDYTNINLQKYPGINKNESVVCATYDTELALLKNTSVPTIGWFYTIPDETGALRMMTTTELKKSENLAILNYVEAASALLENTTVAEVKARYNDALKNDALRIYLENIKKGDYYNTSGTEESTEETTTAPAETQETTTAEPTEAPPGQFVYVSAGTLNVRKEASTDSDVIWKFSKGWCVTVVAEEGDWLRIRDDVQENPANGSTQDCKNFEGYISKQYAVSDYSQIQW